MSRPKVQLTGQNGNVYNLVRLCAQAAADAGWTLEQVDAFTDRVWRCHSYDEVLALMMDEFEVS